MTLPGGSQSFDVIIDLLLKGDADAKKTLESIEKEAIKAGKTLADFSTDQLVMLKALAQAEENRAKDFVKNNQIIIREMRLQAKEIRARNAILLDTASDIDRFAKPLAAGGLLVVGGIFAAANKYVKDAKVATETTIAWKAAQDSLNKSGERIGAVLAKEALPLLKEAAIVTQKIAGFLQANPGVVGVALKGGLLALTLGTLGKAVSSGIRLYADLKMDAALTLQFKAAELQLAAARAQMEAAGVKSASGGITKAAGGGLGAGPIAAILAGGAGAAGIGNAASQFGAGLFGTTPVQFWKDMLDEEKKTIAIWAFDFGKLFGKGSDFFRSATNALGLTKSGDAPGTPPALLGGSQETQDKLLAAYEKYREEDLALVKKHYDDRQGIVADALASTKTENAQYASTIIKINSSANSAIVKAGQDYHAADLKAEQDYLSNRADIIKNGTADLIQLEDDSRERIKKIRENAEDKIANARNRRDALGLRDAKEDRDKAIAEERSNLRKEIARRKQDTAARLQELDAQYQQEKERRLADYQARVAEINQQRAEQIKEAQAAHVEELKKIREQEAAKLKQVDEAFRAEQKHRQAALIAQIRDVDSALLGESNLRRQYHAAMLNDLNKFLTSYQTGLASIGSASSLGTASGGVAGGGTTTTNSGFTGSGLYGTNDAGGYTPKGIYRMAWDGNTEFTLSGPSTKAMERIVGGQLTQANIMQAATRGGGNGNMTLNYNARFDGDVTAAMRRAVAGDIDKAISKFVQGAL